MSHRTKAKEPMQCECSTLSPWPALEALGSLSILGELGLNDVEYRAWGGEGISRPDSRIVDVHPGPRWWLCFKVSPWSVELTISQYDSISAEDGALEELHRSTTVSWCRATLSLNMP